MHASSWCRTIAGTLLTSGMLLAQTTSAAPVDDGPLVCLCNETKVDSVPTTVLALASCDGEHAARQFWSAPGPANPMVRLDRDHLLVHHGWEYDQSTVVNVATGACHRLEGVQHPEVVCVRGDRLYYVHQTTPDPSNTELAHPIWVINWRQPGTPERLTPVSAHQAPLVRGNLVVLLDQERSELWTLSLTSHACRLAYSLPDGFESPIFDLSPGGERLAVGSTDQRHGLLAAIDLGTRKPLRVWKSLNIRDWSAQLYVPQLPVGWSDAGEILSVEYCGSDTGWGGYAAIVRRSVATGKVLQTTECDAELLNKADRLRSPEASPEGFHAPGNPIAGQLLVHGRREPAQAVFASAGRRLMVSPDARYAVETNHGPGGGTALHRLGRKPLRLSDRAASGVRWLPQHRER